MLFFSVIKSETSSFSVFWCPLFTLFLPSHHCSSFWSPLNAPPLCFTWLAFWPPQMTGYPCNEGTLLDKTIPLPFALLQITGVCSLSDCVTFHWVCAPQFLFQPTASRLIPQLNCYLWKPLNNYGSASMALQWGLGSGTDLFHVVVFFSCQESVQQWLY